MSIRARLEDAQALWQAGRKEGAYIQILIAAAGTARKRYPRPIPDNQSFKRFILDEMSTITGGPKYNVAFPFQGKTTPLEDIIYTHLRCQLLHEGEMPQAIVFTEPIKMQGETQHLLRLQEPLGFPAGWVENLGKAVRAAPENANLWDASAGTQQGIVSAGRMEPDSD